MEEISILNGEKLHAFPHSERGFPMVFDRVMIGVFNCCNMIVDGKSGCECNNCLIGLIVIIHAVNSYQDYFGKPTAALESCGCHAITFKRIKTLWASLGIQQFANWKPWPIYR